MKLLAASLPTGKAGSEVSKNQRTRQRFAPQGTGNITTVIPRLRSGSVRLNNFVSQNYSLTGLGYKTFFTINL